MTYIGYLGHIGEDAPNDLPAPGTPGGPPAPERIVVDASTVNSVKAVPAELIPSSAEVRKQIVAVENAVGKLALDVISNNMTTVFNSLNKTAVDACMTKAAISGVLHTVSGVLVPAAIAMCAVPVVGWIMAAIALVIAGLAEAAAALMEVAHAHYQREAMRITAQAQQEAQQLEILWNFKIKELQKQIFLEERDEAIKMALGMAMYARLEQIKASLAENSSSGLGYAALIAAMNQASAAMVAGATQAAAAAQAGFAQGTAALQAGATQSAQQMQQAANDFTNTWAENQRYLEEQWGFREKEDTSIKGRVEQIGDKVTNFVENVGHTIETAVKQAGNIVDQAITDAKNAVQYVDGSIYVEKAEAAKNMYLNQARVYQLANYNINKQAFDRPEFRAGLRMSIAQSILDNPSIRKMINATIDAYFQTPGPVPADVVTSVPLLVQAPTAEDTRTPSQKLADQQKSKALLLAGGGIAAAVAGYFYLK